MTEPAGDFPLAGETGHDQSTDINGSDAGASGTSTGGVNLSHGALVAIIVVVVAVALFGIATSTLFLVAKKREWTVKETLRRSAKKVVDVLTPRRAEFPRSAKESVGGGMGGRRGRFDDDVPPTPRFKPEYLDLEKGMGKKVKGMGFSRK
ncbi:hypothetical protein N0V88_005238 [Collariella sp. IMI 366227]|nr:hypothetical protein N0V88_005238 [Collariella sp. IMI 366227]